MRSKQYFTSIKNNPHEISTDPRNPYSNGKDTAKTVPKLLVKHS